MSAAHPHAAAEQPVVARVSRHASSLGAWEIAQRLPHPLLREHVGGAYQGYAEQFARPLWRREAPTGLVVLIVSFGLPYELRGEDPGARREHHVSFVAGLDEDATLVGHSGASAGVQVDFTPLGAACFFGFPMGELGGRVVTLADALGEGGAAELSERLATAPGWEARFVLLDALLAARIAASAPPAPALAWAWRRLWESDGAVAVGTLAEEVGWSRRHLVARFQAQLGLPPKRLARVLRFRRAVELLRDDDGARLAEIAAACGYYDQAHFNRDVRAFAGVTPGQLIASRLPDGGGFAA